MPQPRLPEKLPVSLSYHFGAIKAWLYLIFCTVINLFCLYIAFYAEGSNQLGGICFTVFFSFLTILSAMVVWNNTINKPCLLFNKRELVFPKNFKTPPITIPYDSISNVNVRHVPAVTEIFYKNAAGETTRQLMWKDMFRSKKDYDRAAELAQACPRGE